MNYLESLINSGKHKLTLSKFLNYDEVNILDVTRSVNVIYHSDFSSTYLSESDYLDVRKKAILYPKDSYITKDDITFSDFEIDIYKIESLNSFDSITHPQILGTITSLGISRDVIGDIIEASDGYYVLVSSSISKYLETNLTKINNSFVTLTKVDMIINAKENYIDDVIMISSLRLDSLVCKVLNISREKAKDYIKEKYVRVNGIIVSKCDLEIKPKDVISITRGGRVIVGDIKGHSKKDKILLNIKKTKKK